VKINGGWEKQEEEWIQDNETKSIGISEMLKCMEYYLAVVVKSTNSEVRLLSNA
jgi:hypothetical protein